MPYAHRDNYVYNRLKYCITLKDIMSFKEKTLRLSILILGCFVNQHLLSLSIASHLVLKISSSSHNRKVWTQRSTNEFAETKIKNDSTTKTCFQPTDSKKIHYTTLTKKRLPIHFCCNFIFFSVYCSHSLFVFYLL